ncbi:MAG: type II toxin-antitoxin system MqsA family antitoxin [Nitrospiraceae bacterium]|nr:MAG: type II toxin-antitoxin system MqsA family antitoxin [Nitrospiraceae bacterium]
MQDLTPFIFERWKNDWKTRKNKVKRCPLCGGEMHDGMTTIPFLISEKVVVIKDVPAEICSDCGEAYMKSSVVDKVESVLDKLDELRSEMSVVHYEVA